MSNKKVSPVLLMFTPEDISYIHLFKPFLKGRPAFFIDQTPETLAELNLYTKSKSIKYVISTNVSVLNKVVQAPKHQSLDNWAGSIFEQNGVTYLFINPLKQFFTVPYGKFLAERFVSKLINPTEWELTPKFTWELLTLTSVDEWFTRFLTAEAIAVDIETVNYVNEKNNSYTLIRCVAYTGLWTSGAIHTVVIPILEAPKDQQMYWITWMRNFNSLKAPKVFQNGLYDNAHFITYASPPENYFWDTQSLFHSWYSELPKRLDFITAFCVHNSFYWKDMAQEGGKMKLFEYNARDGWATMCSWLYLIKHMPDWAVKNYLIKFPLWVPCLASNLEGMKVDERKRAELISQYISDFETIRSRLQKYFGEGFNPGSPTQVTKLIQFYGSTDITNSDEAAVAKFSLRHPLNARFAREITNYRETAKLISTYLKPENYSTSAKPSKRKSFLLKDGRLFYSFNPDGTDTGRLSCSDGCYWTGAQLQNITPKIKDMLIADEGWEIFEIDKERSESYCTGYLSGDKNLLETLRQDREEGRDFHIVNATRFFGIPYEEVTEELRNEVAKRVNHGATYNMGWFVLLSTMGELAVDRAKLLLNLPLFWTRKAVCEHLLSLYDKAYPGVKGDFYTWIKTVVRQTRMLISPLGWTRYCFGNPDKSKHEFNALVAHAPQNLSVGIINNAFKDIYWKIQHREPTNFRLKGQIHDSILGQNRIGHRHLVLEAAKLCIDQTPVVDCHGVKRIMSIPVSIKVGPTWKQMSKIPKII